MEQQTLYNDEYQTCLNDIPGAVLQCLNDASYTMLKVNQAFLNLFGFSEKELKERFQNHFAAMIHPTDRQIVMHDTTSQLATNDKVLLHYRVICKDGSYKWISENGQLIQNIGKEEIFCIILDDTEARNARENQRMALEGQKIILNQTDDIIFEWNVIEDSVILSPNWHEKFGYTPHYLGYTKPKSLSHIHPNDRVMLAELMTEAKNGATFLNNEFRIQTAEGQYLWCRMRGASQYDTMGNPYKVVGVITDIDKEKRMIDDLRRRAECDALTGLYNHAETEQQIRLYLEDKPKEICALLMIDTDNFKQVNDTMGHLFGDAVLTELATTMKKMTRQTDIVGRIGGDEFTIFLKDIPSRQLVHEKVTTLLQMFQSLFEDEKQSIKVTCSVGVAIYPEDGQTFQSLYHSADLALYQAKNQGKNRYVFYDANITELPDQIYSSLGAVIDSDQQTTEGMRNLFSYVFQILYDTSDIDHAIQMILEIVGKRFDVSRAYIFENSPDGKYTDNTYEWCHDGIVPQKENLQHFPYEQIESYEELFQDNAIFYCRDIYSLKPHQVQLFESQGIYSTLQCALRENDAFCGFVGFDECTGKRMWIKEEIGMLSLIAQLLTIFLQKRRVSERDKQLMLQLNAILDVQDAYIYVIDQSNYELLYLNHKIKALDPEAAKGMICYQTFFDRSTPCTNCMIDGGTGEIYNPKYRLWTKVRFAPMKWEDRNAYLLSCFDITEYKLL